MALLNGPILFLCLKQNNYILKNLQKNFTDTYFKEKACFFRPYIEFRVYCKGMKLSFSPKFFSETGNFRPRQGTSKEDSADTYALNP